VTGYIPGISIACPYCAKGAVGIAISREGIPRGVKAVSSLVIAFLRREGSEGNLLSEAPGAEESRRTKGLLMPSSNDESTRPFNMGPVTGKNW